MPLQIAGLWCFYEFIILKNKNMKETFELQKWESAKKKLKNLYPQLTDSDLIWRHETKNDLYDTIATKLVITRREFAKIVDSF